MSPYQAYVASLVRLLEEGNQFPLGEAPFPAHPPASPGAPKALIFSPHPDDEIVMGALPLRLNRQWGWNVVNVAVTLGSNPARRAERLEELERCCRHIGFALLQTGEHGLENVNVQTRAKQPDAWRLNVARVAEILSEEKPRAIFFPHPDDWNSTHIGTHHLIMDALESLGPEFSCLLGFTEFWGAMDHPNLMVESTAADLADLITALTFHVGEVRRNPYHLRLPAWMIDNVRRGCELVGGQGRGAPPFAFATLYRLERWREGRSRPAFEGGRFLAARDSLAELFNA